MFQRTAVRAVVSAAVLISGAGAAAQPCEPQWDLSIGAPGANTGYIDSFIVWNDGTGEKLYVGGSFTGLAGRNYVAAYDLATGAWSGLANGISASFVSAFAVFNPGSGEKLIVGGANWNVTGVPGTQNLAMWDGQNWHATGAALASNTQSIQTLHVWNDGSGAKLYAGGGFDTIGGVAASRIASWSGTSWQPLGAGAGGTVFTITNFNDGTGDALYAAGRFTTIGGQGITNIARWNGTSWSQVGGGLLVLSSTQQIQSLRVLDMGSGQQLFACGSSFVVEGGAVANAARWNGQNWSALGQQLSGSLRQMVVLDEGDGPKLYSGAAGATGGGAMGYFIRLNETANQWETTGAFFDNTVFGVYRHANRLYLGGSFTSLNDGGPAGTQTVRRIVSRTICPAGPACYANCDGSTTPPVLNVADFTCFLQKFAAGDAYANCDGSIVPPVLNVADFTCFLQKFAAGCR